MIELCISSQPLVERLKVLVSHSRPQPACFPLMWWPPFPPFSHPHVAPSSQPTVSLPDLISSSTLTSAGRLKDKDDENGSEKALIDDDTDLHDNNFSSLFIEFKQSDTILTDELLHGTAKKQSHFGQEKTLFNIPEELLKMGSSLSCLWADMINPEVEAGKENIALMVPRPLVFSGVLSHSITLE